MALVFDDQEIEEISLRRLPVSAGPVSLDELDGCVVFGAGLVARQLLRQIRRAGRSPAWIVDNDSKLHGTSVEGAPVRDSGSLREAGERPVVIASSFLAPMSRDCARSGVRNWHWYTDVSDVFGDLEICLGDPARLRDPELARLWGLLDEESRQVLRGALAFRLTGERGDLPRESPDQYFAPDLVPAARLTHFVDCGAYTGDTLLDWVRRVPPGGCSYHGFEPDPDSFRKLASECRRLSASTGPDLHVYPDAVGRGPGYVGMAQGGSGTVLGAEMRSGPRARVVRLDDALEGRRVSALKMDLEGYEPHALEGAQGLVRSQRPLLLVAVYHRPEHLWEIPLWIHDLGLGYRLRLRHHSSSFAETVCYASPAPG
ncbi:MAG: FkbM family methyltransferase [Thermoanaerobaculia bacterium]